MLPSVVLHGKPATEKGLGKASHLLFVLPAQRPDALPFAEVLDAKLKRRKEKYEDLGKSPLVADLPNGGIAAWVVLKDGGSAFERHTALRKAVSAPWASQPAQYSRRIGWRLG